MTDKLLVKQRFEKSFKTYDDNAVIQKITAERLIEMLGLTCCNSVFEAGCATGILTKLISKKISYKKYTANDIVEKSKDYISNIMSNFEFIPGDIETINLPENYDLIISNACLQWCDDIYSVADKLYKRLNPGGKLVFSIFGNENLKEIIDVFDIQPEPLNIDKFIFPDILLKEEKIVLEFNSLTEILKHLKYTGVNAIKHFSLTKSSLKEYEAKYNSLYSKNGKLLLTYNPVYVLISG